MSEKCEKYLERILSPEIPLGNDAGEHLVSCRECRELRRAVMTVTPRQVPEMLSAAILEQGALRSAGRRFRRGIIRFASLGAAALILLGFGLFSVWSPDGGVTGKGTPAMRNGGDTVDWSVLERESFYLDQELSACTVAYL